MIEIASHLRCPDGRFVEVSSGYVPDGHRYVEGAVELIVNGQSILDLTMWDYVDQLWSYIVGLLEKLRECGESTSYFPDQPIQISFRRVEHKAVLVAVRTDGVDRSGIVGEDELVEAVVRCGIVFFREISEVVPENSGSYLAEIERLSNIR